MKKKKGEKIVHDDPEEVKELAKSKYGEEPKIEKSKYEDPEEAEKPEPEKTEE